MHAAKIMHVFPRRRKKSSRFHYRPLYARSCDRLEEKNIVDMSRNHNLVSTRPDSSPGLAVCEMRNGCLQCPIQKAPPNSCRPHRAVRAVDVLSGTMPSAHLDVVTEEVLSSNTLEIV